MTNYQKSKDTYILRLDIGQEICTEIKKFCIEHNIRGASIQGIGFANNIKLGTYNSKKQDYDIFTFKNGHEITSLVGNVTTKGDDLIIHIHGNFSNEKCEIIGGHLFEATIALTAEIFIRELDNIKRNTETHRLLFY